MKKNEFDELQQSRRYRYGYQSFILLAFLLILDNILYSVGIVWEQHPVNTFILLLASCAYFISRCIWGDALVGPKETPTKMTARTAVVILIAVVVSVIAVGYAAITIKIHPSVDRGGSILFPYILAMWAVVGIVYLIKRFRENKED